MERSRHFPTGLQEVAAGVAKTTGAVAVTTGMFVVATLVGVDVAAVGVDVGIGLPLGGAVRVSDGLGDAVDVGVG